MATKFVITTLSCLTFAVTACLALVSEAFGAQIDSAHQVHVRLSVTPVPTTSDPAPGTPEVTWSTGNGSPGLVTVTASGASEAVFASGPDGSEPAPWISVGQSYIFKLYSTTSGRQLLARLKIGRAVTTTIVSLPRGPHITSRATNRLLQAISVTALAIVIALTVMYINEVRRSD